jgi:dipeptidyl aminopeptidase/acylaminoacyl peptidase
VFYKIASIFLEGFALMKKLLLILAGFSLSPASAQIEHSNQFGARPAIESISISPDGSHIAIVEPRSGPGSALIVANLGDGQSAQILTSNGDPVRLSWCEWASNTRLVCELFATMNDAGTLIGMTRLVAVNSDGTLLKQLGQRETSRQLGRRQFDGRLIGWNSSDNGQVLMSRYYVPEGVTGTILSSREEGTGADWIDTITLKATRAEAPRSNVSSYMADTEGRIRLMSTEETTDAGRLRGLTHYYYRLSDSKGWKRFSDVADNLDGLVPIAIDGKRNFAYAVGKKDGRNAIFKVSLDENLTQTLLIANDKVDVTNLLRMGRTGRIIGASYTTDRAESKIFDSEYDALAIRLAKALPGLPLISFAGASRDESKLLLFAGSDIDPGRYYVYDKGTKRLSEVSPIRPQLDGILASKVKPITYKASDGTQIPAYLTLPKGGVTSSLPAIVMPHGGPSARDEWGFDWLAQYYVSQGYAVLQPNFRGSAGYGDDWYVNNGFKSWRIAIGDVNDAGKWLVSQGIADPKKLAIVGWSYGGYAALQSGVIDPDLYKAVVAIAPVTDLKLLISQSQNYTNSALVADFVGNGDHIVSGSPLQNAGLLKAPILMFSGNMDLNVNVAQSKAMNAELKRLGKATELVLFPGLDHQLEDSGVRAAMLKKSNEFLRTALGIK